MLETSFSFIPSRHSIPLELHTHDEAILFL